LRNFSCLIGARIRRHAYLSARLLAVISVALSLPTVSHADVVTYWNRQASVSIDAAQPSPSEQARTFAMLHIAIYDALTKAPVQVDTRWSPETVAHAAAHRLLVELLPAQRRELDTAFESAMSAAVVDDLRPKEIAAGEGVAVNIAEARKTDGYLPDAKTDYRPVTAPGVYVMTELPVGFQLANAKPFALQSAAQFRPGPPPALEGPVWARDYNETKNMGGANSTKRTAWQTETARFWDSVSGTDAWNTVARSLVASRPLPLIDCARLFMQLNVAMADTGVAVFEAKYHYAFWRPITAIRNGDIDGNEATERDSTWRPVISTPLHPEYPCGHCIVDGAAIAVLRSRYGDGTLPEIALTTAALPGVTHLYTSFHQLSEEVDNARIWGGMHFRNSAEVAEDMGRRIGEYVLTSYPR
jgi:hypothetical protein